MNDTISGDPVLTVPILVSEEELQSVPAEQLSLCYEVHGQSNKWFNLVSDECASVSAYYTGLNERLNVIDKIAIRAIDNRQRCVDTSVSIENSCSSVVNGVLTSRYSSGGVSVHTFMNRVRISVPNCGELTLVMWVICKEQQFQVMEPEVGGVASRSVTRNNIEFVVMRGLNYGHRLAHGLIGMKIISYGSYFRCFRVHFQ